MMSAATMTVDARASGVAGSRVLSQTRRCVACYGHGHGAHGGGNHLLARGDDDRARTSIPAVTLTFFRLGKISGRDALAYICAQFTGGVVGIGSPPSYCASGSPHPAVNYVATLPGLHGIAVAFAARSGDLVRDDARRAHRVQPAALAPFTGVIVARARSRRFITLEAPLSGMSMNPARTLGPDLVGDMWRGLWIYFVAPPLGMLAAAETFVRVRGRLVVRCAKLHHDRGQCIFNCGVTEEPSCQREHYDVIIIGTGAGGGTLAHRLAPSGKRILILERGDYVPREKENWDSRAVNVDARYHTKEVWHDKDGKPLHPHTNYYVGGNTKFYGAALFRLREQRLRRDSPSRRHLAGVADHVSTTSSRTTRRPSSSTKCTARAARIRPSRAASGDYPFPAVSHEPRIQQFSDDFARSG